MSDKRRPLGQDLLWRAEALGFDLFIGVVRLLGVDAASAFGGWLGTQAGQAAWLGLRWVASNFIEQPWYGAARSAFGSPGLVAGASALAAAAYLAGVYALRRLLALPTQQARQHPCPGKWKSCAVRRFAASATDRLR